MANLREIEEQHMAALANAARSADARVRRMTDGSPTRRSCTSKQSSICSGR